MGTGTEALAAALARAAAAEAENASLRAVAVKVMAAVDLEAALSSVTHEALAALDADIAGVFLREGERIVMRGCVGNRNRQTARLRMGPNEGLAGLVFATGDVARVDSYLRSDVISDHFRDLARAEQVRSALAAPLSLGGEVIGVLEVWRRRRAVFTPAETQRLVALAELGAIALNNARLRDATTQSMREVEVAHRQMQTHLHRVEHALATQQELVSSIIDGGGSAAIVRIAAQRTSGTAVHLDAYLEPVAVYPPGREATELSRVLREHLSGAGRAGGQSWVRRGERPVIVRAVSSGTDHFGWLGLAAGADASDEDYELAVTQASLACSLSNLQEQAVARARAGAQEELLLSLLDDSANERRTGLTRARSLRIDLTGRLRVLVCELRGLDAAATAEGWTGTQLDAIRRGLTNIVRAGLSARAVLAAGRDDTVLVLMRAGALSTTREALARVTTELVAARPDVAPTWGVSAVHERPADLADALAEARTALRALRHVPDRAVSCHDDLGILRLMLAEPGSTDLSRFVTETVGPIISYDRAHRGVLMPTLRAYFDCGCSQQDAAARMFVHAKTIKYRLVQVEKLTGLDLADHHDRLRADIAVRAAELFATGAAVDAGPGSA